MDSNVTSTSAETVAMCMPEEGMDKAMEKNPEAEIKGMTLLRDQIGDEKFIKFVACNFIEIKGKYGMYEISRKGVRLKRFDKIGKKIRPLTYNLCIDSIGNIPEGDRLLSIYISIQKDENKFIETANFRNVYTDDEYQTRRRLGEQSPNYNRGPEPRRR